MHGLVLLDAADTVLRPAILWNDQRTAHACDEIREAVGPERLIAITGNDALTGFTAPKLVWVRDHEPDVWARVAHVLLPKDYVRLRLTGDYALDKADGAGRSCSTSRRATGRRRSSPPSGSTRPGCRRRSRVRSSRAGPARGGRGDRAACRHPGRGRRRRPGRERGRGGRGRRRASWPSRSGRRASSFAATRPPLREPRRPGPRVLPRGPRSLAPDVRDAVGGRVACAGSATRSRPGVDFGALVGGGRRACPPGATGCCSCPTSPASAARTRTRSPAARSSG